jgi:hypothetical protein
MLIFFEKNNLVNEKVQMEIIARLMVVCSKRLCMLQCFSNNLKILTDKKHDVKIENSIFI